MAEPRPSTVCIVDAPDELQDVSAFPDAPALQAIHQGLGSYLESIGFIAEHPLLYVRETGDPYVYVQFRISPDGRGFLDETFVYSPGVTEQLHALYKAYGILETDPPAAVHRSETFKFGRPIHASIWALEAYREEEDMYNSAPGGQRKADQVAARVRALERRREKKWRRRWLRWQIKRGNVQPKLFGTPFAGVPIGYRTGPDFNALPLNWDWNAELPSTTGNNWYVGDKIETPAAASVDVWRKIVEPRLPHASGDPDGYTGYATELGATLRGMGDEWWYGDVLYWSYKTAWEAVLYPGGVERESHALGNVFDTLFEEFEALGQRIQDAVRGWRETTSVQIEYEFDKRDQVISAALKDPTVQQAIFVDIRQNAICGLRRHGVRTLEEASKFLSDHRPCNNFGICPEAFVYKAIYLSLPPWAHDAKARNVHHGCSS